MKHKHKYQNYERDKNGYENYIQYIFVLLMQSFNIINNTYKAIHQHRVEEIVAINYIDTGNNN